MIWFPCNKCGKTHGRPESSAGTMIFCDCGHGNTIPWESTTAEPMVAPTAMAAPKGPDLAPIQFEPVKGTHAPPSAEPPRKASNYPAPPPALEDDERNYRRGRSEKRDPEFCFNHQRRPRVGTCADCEENFCADCLVKFQGVLSCAACKNFRARREELPAAASSMASASVIITLIAGPLMMCLLLASPASGHMRVLAWLSLLPQFLALGLAVWALREAERERKGGGQWMAVTGVATAGLSCVLMLLLQMYANRIA